MTAVILQQNDSIHHHAVSIVQKLEHSSDEGSEDQIREALGGLIVANASEIPHEQERQQQRMKVHMLNHTAWLLSR